MKIIQVAGFLGSGKTTTLIALSRNLTKDLGKKVAVIVNEIGSVPVDAKIIEEYGLKVMDIGGGCICCEVAASMALTLRELEQLKPDIVLVEPTGVALPQQVKEAIMLGGNCASIQVGRVAVLFDGLKGEELLGDRELKDFVVRQIREADIIALNKVDAITEGQANFCESRLREYCPDIEIIRISARNGMNIGLLANKLMRD